MKRRKWGRVEEREKEGRGEGGRSEEENGRGKEEEGHIQDPRLWIQTSKGPWSGRLWRCPVSRRCLPSVGGAKQGKRWSSL